MIAWLKSWIVTICTAVVFITAVEMILPDNKMKSYGKFVMGLMLMVVIMTPIIKILNKNINIDEYINKAEKSFSAENNYKSSIENYKTKDEEDTKKQFKENLEATCTKILKEKFPDADYSASVEISEDEDSKVLAIKSISIGVKEKGIEKISKIQIGKNSERTTSTQNLNDSEKEKIKNFISNEINVSDKDINVYKL
ncbi:stage III sporulation protein AF [Clostridium guangxiense]|uniref:stage III sporulation protein AF n=1 Tax=Clostridium guangxiense TaxID=1662055 RepID=UPI001E4241DE|nr:stage III sporulation protein AF [Clostridium guangxiense]